MLPTMQSLISTIPYWKLSKDVFDELLRIILCERSLVATLCRDDIIKELVGQRYIVAIKNGYNTMYVTVSSVCMIQCAPEWLMSYLSHFPRVKSGISTGAPPLFADVWVNSTRQLHNAAS